MLNVVIMMGRLTADPELKRTGSGIAVARFRIAVERDYAPKDGEKKTDFFECVAWRQTGEFISKYFTKGRMIVVHGSLEAKEWNDRDGNKRYGTEINVDNAYFGDSKRDGNNGNGGNNYGSNRNGGGNNYGAPVGGYNAPAGGYNAPVGGYGASAGGYNAPVGGYNANGGNYGANGTVADGGEYAPHNGQINPDQNIGNPNAAGFNEPASDFAYFPGGTPAPGFMDEENLPY